MKWRIEMKYYSKILDENRKRIKHTYYLKNVQNSVKRLNTRFFSYNNFDIGAIRVSPYSESCYLELYYNKDRDNKNNFIDKGEIFVIRVSNHLPNDFPSNLLLNIYSKFGNFSLNVLKLKLIHDLINKIQKDRYEYFMKYYRE